MAFPIFFSSQQICTCRMWIRPRLAVRRCLFHQVFNILRLDAKALIRRRWLKHLAIISATQIGLPTMTEAFVYEQAFHRNIGWFTRKEQQLLRSKRVAV